MEQTREKYPKNRKSYISKENILNFMRSFQISIYNCHNPKGIKSLKKLRLSLGHFRQHKFNYIFQDTLNPIRNRCNDIETSSHYLFRNRNYFQKNT